MRYCEQLKGILKSLAIGYGIGGVLAFFFSLLIEGGFTSNVFPITIACLFIFGSVIGIIMVMRKGMAFTIVISSCVKVAKMAFTTMVSAAFGFGILGLVIFIIPMAIFCVLASVMAMYVLVSFPITVLFVVIMAAIEKFITQIPDNVADLLDKIVPVASTIGTFCVIYLAAF